MRSFSCLFQGCLLISAHKQRPHFNESHKHVKAVLDDSAVALPGHDLGEDSGDEEAESVVDEDVAKPSDHHSEGDAEVLLREQHFCWNLLCRREGLIFLLYFLL